MKIIIPQTLIQEEFKSRMASLEKRFGSQEKVADYFKQL
jgi:FKBP-type peptidyl-prolyl cis-trans isomerase (trigger factor)